MLTFLTGNSLKRTSECSVFRRALVTCTSVWEVSLGVSLPTSSLWTALSGTLQCCNFGDGYWLRISGFYILSEVSSLWTRHIWLYSQCADVTMRIVSVSKGTFQISLV